MSGEPDDVKYAFQAGGLAEQPGTDSSQSILGIAPLGRRLAPQGVEFDSSSYCQCKGTM